MSEVAIEVRDLRLSLGGRAALRGVSLDLLQGQCTGIVGETGSGKTLFCKSITGMLGGIAGVEVEGSVRYEDRDLLRLPEREWRSLRGRRIAFVPQHSLHCLDPVMRVDHQVFETVRELQPEADPRTRALELLDQVAMARPEEVLEMYPHELSGGMKQRLMIALALVGDPEILIADEPTTALDVTVQRGILELLQRLSKESGMSMVLVGHDLGVVEWAADRVAVMYAGSVVEEGPAASILRHPAHPYTRALLSADLSLARRGQRLEVIEGSPPPLGAELAGCCFADRCSERRDRCLNLAPDAVEVGEAHRAACFYAEERR